MTTNAKLEGTNAKRTLLLALGGVLSLGAVVIAAFAGTAGEALLPVFATGALVFVVGLGLHSRALHRRLVAEAASLAEANGALAMESESKRLAEQRLDNTDRTMRSEIEARARPAG